MSNKKLFSELGEAYPQFVYESYSCSYEADRTLVLKFHFRIGDNIEFFPQHKINLCAAPIDQQNNDILSNLAFHIGMVELISYWKVTCSPQVLIKPFNLTPIQQKWWKKLYYNGLGEFFYLNGIDTSIDNFMSIAFSPDATPIPNPIRLHLKDEFIIPVGGGKDSVVTLSLLGKLNNSAGMVVNQREATKDCLEAANLLDCTYEIKRRIDPTLLDLNSKGFLNGHTPFSSLLAFVSALISVVSGKKHIALSNEASANEVTIPGTHVNHQYSKSYEFEQDFRWYLHTYICPDINYFSFLRPLNELQIAALFAKERAFFEVFKSCNAGSKTNIWCCKCPKCLFTWIILSPFIAHDRMVEIFGEDLWHKESLKLYLEQLTGIATEKPFECVGTIDEVNAALQFVVQNNAEEQNTSALLQHYQKHISIKELDILEGFLAYWNPQHNLDKRLEDILKSALKQLK